MDRFDLQEVVASLELVCGESYGCATADPLSDNLPDTVGDVLQAGGGGVAASVHRPGCGGSCGVEGLDLRLLE